MIEIIQNKWLRRILIVTSLPVAIPLIAVGGAFMGMAWSLQELVEDIADSWRD
jgi:hypothetical protein